MAHNENHPTKGEKKQASVLIAVISAIGLVTCVVFSYFQDKEVSLILYAIFGGGILGTDNVLKLLKTVFRVND